MNPDVHARRRSQLVEAVFRIVGRDGVEHVSVRNVAHEAGLSAGSLRHYFATQGELLTFALGEVERRIRIRLQNVDTVRNPPEVLEQVLHHLVPVTPQSRLDHEIWLAFVCKAITDPALQALNERIYDDLRALLRLRLQAVLRPGQDLEMETDRLYALVDGLVLHAAIRPAQWNAQRLIDVLHQHMTSLTGTRRKP